MVSNCITTIRHIANLKKRPTVAFIFVIIIILACVSFRINICKMPPIQHDSSNIASPCQPIESIKINNNITSIVNTHNAKNAPNGCAGIWRGDISTIDGAYGYIIGHNPGVFSDVVSLTRGDIITVCDSIGYTKEYTVFDTLDVPVNTTWGDIKSHVISYGECIAVQTCIENGDKIVVAAPLISSDRYFAA